MDGLLRVALLSFTICIAYVLGRVIYNVFLHPLRRYPGPPLWAASRLPWCYYQYRGRLPIQILELHKRYGHVVRISPNELSYTDASAWKTIYGNRREEMPKDPVFRLHTPTGAQNILVADRETHTRQRRLLSHAFSESALREQEPILQLHARKLMTQLSLRTDIPVNIVDWLVLASFDLIGHMSFGESFRCLDRGTYDPFVEAISAMASELTYTQMAKYWGMERLRQLFTPKALLGQRRANIGRAMATVGKRIKQGSEHRDFLHYILSANDEKGMSPEEIYVNAFSLSTAGSESTATALSGAIFFILTNPHVYETLTKEIRTKYTHEDDITLVSSNSLPYLDAVITETLRLYPPVAITMPRVVPASGETIASSFVPGGTSVGVPHFAISHHPDNFHRAEDFCPQRWLPIDGGGDTAFANDVKEAMQPFSLGPRGCLGKNIARAEMRLLFAKLVWAFDFTLCEGQEEWREQKCQGFWQKGPLWVELERRTR
ncbi:monooxygenase [Elsinoe ampelina]|uniref:Monooxygenase n=1 Tax=Elsinoe ampelina TaxID=302913 RepID=A0A6A6G233_9PEZI|nr:monooxygenase [Elsinoe ampelina]